LRRRRARRYSITIGITEIRMIPTTMRWKLSLTMGRLPTR
jgi:hypothetical protein